MAINVYMCDGRGMVWCIAGVMVGLVEIAEVGRVRGRKRAKTNSVKSYRFFGGSVRVCVHCVPLVFGRT